MLNNKKGIIILFIAVIVCGVGYTVKSHLTENIIVEQENVIIQKQETTEKMVLPESTQVIEEVIEHVVEETIKLKTELKIYICGEVNNPKVVTLQSDSRIIDALNLAGGATELADLNRVNLAEFVYDAEKIYIPKIGEEVDKIEIIAQNSTIEKTVVNNELVNNTLININTADKARLEDLTGIGEVIAQSIIDYRQLNGGFKSIDEIKNVSRIGEKTFDKIKDEITLDN